MSKNENFNYDQSGTEEVLKRIERIEKDFSERIASESEGGAADSIYKLLYSLSKYPFLSEYNLESTGKKVKDEANKFLEQLSKARINIDTTIGNIKEATEKGKKEISASTFSSLLIPVLSTGTPTINSPYDALEYYKRRAAEATEKGNTEEAERWNKRAGALQDRIDKNKYRGEDKTEEPVSEPSSQTGNYDNNYSNGNYGNYYSNTNANATDNGTRSNIETVNNQDENNKQTGSDISSIGTKAADGLKGVIKGMNIQPKNPELAPEVKAVTPEPTPEQVPTTPAQEGAGVGSDIAIPPTPGSSNNGNGSNNSTSVPIPNTETHSDNPIAAGVDKVAPEKPGDSTGTSIVGEAKDLFKNRGKSTPNSKPVLPKSESTKSSTSTNSKGFNPVPLAVGLGAAVAGGVGIKAYKDHKENSSFNDENEDSFSNGNRFWSEDDPNVINSEEDMVSGDDLFSEQTTSPSYSAMINEDNNSISNEGWALEEQPVEDNDSFDLLGEN